MDPPPSYDSTVSSPSSQESNAKDQPPSYSAPTSLITAANLSATTSTPSSSFSSSSSWDPLPDEPSPTLILDGCTIYSASHPSRALYILSSPPAEAVSKVYGLEKVCYRTRLSDGAVKQGQRKHVYDFTTAFGASPSVRASVEITGRRSPRSTFRKVTLSPAGPPGAWSSSHFKSSGAEDGGSNLKVSPALADARSRLAWREAGRGDGRVLAMETRGTRDVENRMVVMPRLEIAGGEGAAAVVQGRDLDLLVACWCARVWREAVKETREPMSWERFKRIASNKTSRSDIARLGGYL